MKHLMSSIKNCGSLDHQANVVSDHTIRDVVIAPTFEPITGETC
jgi:hypothetical protein